mgnify:CR=1 FL=1
MTSKGRKSKPLHQKSAGQLQAAPTPTINLVIEKKRLPYSLSTTSNGKKLKASSSYSNQGSTEYFTMFDEDDYGNVDDFDDWIIDYCKQSDF